MQRIFDITIIIILSPIILTIFIIFFFLGLLFQGVPVIFSQSRGGYKNKKFKIYKFRSMHNKKRGYNRSVTFYGKIIRRLKIDEIPQFYNVLKGDISIVGPRPLHYEYKKFYNKTQLKRFNVRPGMTGYSQVFCQNSSSWTKKLMLDVWYVENKTIILDLKIIFMTIIKILKSIFLGKANDFLIKKFNGKN